MPSETQGLTAQEMARRVLVSSLVLLLLVTLALTLWKIRLVFLLFLLAVVIASAMRPGVETLRRRGVPRGVGIAVHYLALSAIVGLLLFFAVPLSGWAHSSASGFPVVWFGVIALPDWVPVDRLFADAVLKPLHQTCAFALATLALLHVGATCKHQFVDRDGLFWRIWPRGAPR